MTILDSLKQLRDDLKAWVTNNLQALNKKIDEKTISVDTSLSASSKNPVQNKVITEKISSLEESSFSGDYNDLTNAPNISESSDNELIIADEQGNIAFKIDEAGAHVKDLEVDGTNIREKISEWDNKSDFSGSYADLQDAPDIIEDDSKTMIVADEKGHIIAKVDENGFHTTTINANQIMIDNQDILDLIENHTIEIDDSFDTESINPVQNKIVAEHTLNNTIHISENERQQWNSKSDFSGDFNDLDNSPIVDDSNGNVIVADESGNIIFKVDKNGAHSTALSLNGVDIKEIINNQDHFSGDYNDLTNAPIIADNTGELNVVDESGNIIFKIDKNGIHTTDLSLNNENINDKIESFNNHSENTTIHITSNERNSWNNKVDKVSGKNLSTNDYTTTDKNKLAATNIAYGTCSTAAGTAAKIISITGNTNWKLTAGSLITILFSATNSANNPTFNVNNTGAKNVFYTTSQITTSNKSYAGYANRPMTFMYDGTQYRFIGWGVDNNSDTKVTQATAITTAGEYPIILGYDTNTTAVTNTVNKAAELTYNPSTKTLTATTFKGALSGTADKATKDSNGNTITSTYATKAYVDEQISAAISASY